MIEYLKYGLYLVGAIILAIVLGLAFFKIIDLVFYIANKLGDLIFGKEAIKMKNKKLGVCQVSPTGLRRMANAIQKKYQTKGNVDLELSVTEYRAKNKIKRTFGIKL